MQLLVKTCVCVYGCGAGCMREGVWRAACAPPPNRRWIDTAVFCCCCCWVRRVSPRPLCHAGPTMHNLTTTELEREHTQTQSHATVNWYAVLRCTAPLHVGRVLICLVAGCGSPCFRGACNKQPPVGFIVRLTPRVCTVMVSVCVCVGRRRDILARYPWQHCAVNKIINDRYFRFVYTMFGWRKA